MDAGASYGTVVSTTALFFHSREVFKIMAKTYVPTLRFLANQGYKYGTRWQTKLEGSMTGEQYSCLVTWLSATLALLICLGATPINA